MIPVRVGFTTHGCYDNLRAGQRRRGDHPEGRRRDIAGNLETLRGQALTAPYRDRTSASLDPHTERLQRPLRMIPRGKGLVDRRHTVAVQTGQQDGGFDLRAGHFGGELDRVNSGQPLNRQRWPALLGSDPGSHSLQGHDDPPHRTAAQRVIAGDRGLERVGGQNSGQHPHGAAGVACVEHGGGCDQAAQAPAR